VHTVQTTSQNEFCNVGLFKSDIFRIVGVTCSVLLFFILLYAYVNNVNNRM